MALRQRARRADHAPCAASQLPTWATTGSTRMSGATRTPAAPTPPTSPATSRCARPTDRNPRQSRSACRYPARQPRSITTARPDSRVASSPTHPEDQIALRCNPARHESGPLRVSSCGRLLSTRMRRRARRSSPGRPVCAQAEGRGALRGQQDRGQGFRSLVVLRQTR